VQQRRGHELKEPKMLHNADIGQPQYGQSLWPTDDMEQVQCRQDQEAACADGDDQQRDALVDVRPQPLEDKTDYLGGRPDSLVSLPYHTHLYAGE